MLRRFTISEAQARHAIERGEFDAEVVSSAGCVAVVLTQGWCSQWRAMGDWLDRLVELGEPKAIDIDVWQLVYDRVPYFREFLEFKESRLGNYEVPYVRYYVAGRLKGESNSVRPTEFLGRFDSGAGRGAPTGSG